MISRRSTNVAWLLAILSFLVGMPDAVAQRAGELPEFRVRNLASLNSPEDEYAPYLLPDATGLFFTSSASGSANLYLSRLVAGDWSAATVVAIPGVNTERDDGALSGPFPPLAQLFPLDAPTLTQLNSPPIALLTSGKRPEGKGDADIYMVRMLPVGGLSDEVIPLEQINTRGWESQPSIAPDGGFIIFASDRKGGSGGTDLYISYKHQDGTYGAPVNMGALVNTGGDEMSPHVAPDSKTLFFSSDGRHGFGGMDFFRSRLGDDGQWATPENLGDQINTDANEIFFYGAGFSVCFFASDRKGGKGGLDLYEGTPNIFASSVEQITWRSRDTVSGRGIGGRLRIIEKSTGRLVKEVTVDAEKGVYFPLPTQYQYRIEFDAEGYPDTTLQIDRLATDRATIRQISYGRVAAQPVVVASKRDLRLEGIDVPLFVSGYYRLNTTELLEELVRLQSSGVLRGQTYVANVTTDESSRDEYEAMAASIDRKLGDFIRGAVRDDFPAFDELREEGELLEIVVSGYADPRPIIGVYREGPVTFTDAAGRSYTVARGDSLTNFRLAGLRAAYAVEHLDRLLRREAEQSNKAYIDLSNRGLIRWRAVSGDVDDMSGGDNLAEKRRIRLEFRRIIP